MKINAIIEKRDGGTLVLDFPRSIYDVRWLSEHKFSLYRIPSL